MDALSCSGRFVRPFIRELARDPRKFSSLDTVLAITHSDRVELVAAYRSLQEWVLRTGDRDIGLKAGASMRFGEGGALDFAVRSAATLRDSLDVAARHAPLFSDGVVLRLDLHGAQAFLRFEDQLNWPPVAADFTLASFYARHLRKQLPAEFAPVVCFPYERPSETTEHERAFPGLCLNFGAAHYGFAFDSEWLELPLPSANPELHQAHADHLERLRARLARGRGFTLHVRGLVAGELRYGRPIATVVAKRLEMSHRTMVRRLHHEGTTFRHVVDELRRCRALHLIRRPEISLAQMASLLGFSKRQAFHRAFVRWTGRTPSRYRADARQLRTGRLPLEQRVF